MGWIYTFRGNTPVKEFLASRVNCENEHARWQVHGIAIVRMRTAYLAVEIIRRNQETGALDIPLVRKSGLLEEILVHDLAPGQRNTIRPLAPLKNGHLALMLAGGYMNGEIEMNGRHLVIKGVVHKTVQVHSIAENNKGETTVTTRDRYQPTVKAIDMAKAEMLIIQ